MLFKYALSALSLAYGISAVPDGKSILGYRTVVKAEADAINAAGRPVYEDREQWGGRQIGPGVYTTPRAGQWPGRDPVAYCVIYIDSDRLDVVSKIWVPQYYYPYWYSVFATYLWGNDNSANIPQYVTDTNDEWDPATTLYMSWISKVPNQLQLLIPPQLVKPEGALGLSAVCVDSLDQLPDNADVDYDSWEKNITGDRGDPDI